MSRVLRDASSTVHVVVADAATAAATSVEIADGGDFCGGGGAAVLPADVAVNSDADA